MLSFTAALLLTALLPQTYASLATECRNVALRNLWLYAECTDLAGRWVSSTAYLPNYITNSETKLQWKASGAYQQSCSGCIYTPANTSLTCNCQGTYTSDRLGRSSVNLSQHILPLNGTLSQNLTSTPSPLPYKPFPVPSDLSLGLNYTTNTADCSGTTTYPATSTPAPGCWDVAYYVYLSAMSATMYNNQGWQIVGYPSQKCAGAAVATLTPSTSTTACNAFSPVVKSFSFTPLWNYI